MLRQTGAHFGTASGGASVVSVLAHQPEMPPADIRARLSRPRTPIAGVLGEKQIGLHVGEATLEAGAVTVPVRVGRDACRLHLSPSLIGWLQQRLELEGELVDEEPLQRALLLELACLDLLRMLEARLGADIRFGEGGDTDLSYPLDVAILSDDRTLPLRLELPLRLAEAVAEFLDHVQPPPPPDLSGLTAEIVIEAGSQDLTRDELESLQPGDVVMLAIHRPVMVVDGKLVASVRRHSGGVELDGLFQPKAQRAMVGSLADLGEGGDGTHILHMVAEFARGTMTLGQIDALKPRELLPFAPFEETGVDIVIDNRRVGRGELVVIGAGIGVRIVHLLPAAPA